MSWTELFVVLLVSHLVGDFIVQTEFQAVNKHGGLGRDPVNRRALLSHVVTYSAAYIPALVWIAVELDAGTAVLAALAIALPHGIQDDGRLLRAWMQRVKHTTFTPGPLAMAVDQSFHVVALFLLSLAVGR